MKSREANRKMEFFWSLMAFLLIEQTVGRNIESEEDPYIEGDAASLEDDFSGEVPCPELPACRYFQKLCWSSTHSLYDFVIRQCPKSCKLC